MGAELEHNAADVVHQIVCFPLCLVIKLCCLAVDKKCDDMNTVQILMIKG